MISYKDILGKPWREMHCGQVAAEALWRMGNNGSLYVADCQESAAQLIKEYAEGKSPWECVGDTPMAATREGDIVMCSGPDGLHVSVYLGQSMALTSTERHGVHAIPLGRLRGIVGVYRFGKVPA